MLRFLLLVLLLVAVTSALVTFYRYDEGEADERVGFFHRSRREGRFCGNKLVNTMKAICGGCVKPPDSDVMKRSGLWSPPPIKRQSLVTDCCKNKCSFDYLKKFCC